MELGWLSGGIPVTFLALLIGKAERGLTMDELTMDETTESFHVIDRGNGWEAYSDIHVGPSYFEALGVFLSAVRDNPGNYYYLTVEAGSNVRILENSEGPEYD